VARPAQKGHRYSESMVECIPGRTHIAFIFWGNAGVIPGEILGVSGDVGRKSHIQGKWDFRPNE
jgi:hypothetical protein